MKKWVYLFGEVAAAEKYAGSWEGVRALLIDNFADQHRGECCLYEPERWRNPPPHSRRT